MHIFQALVAHAPQGTTPLTTWYHSGAPAGIALGALVVMFFVNKFGRD